MKRIKFLRRILASSLAVLLCCTSFNMTALAAEDSELPYGITSEQEIAVTQVDEENSCLDGIEEEAYQRSLGVVAQEIVPEFPSPKTWGQVLSPFTITATKEDPTVAFTMTAPTLSNNEESFADTYGLAYKVAVQDADDPSAPVMFFAATVDEDNNSVTATIPVGSETKLCALVQVDTANLTENVTYSAQNQVAMPESIYENADGSVLHFSWTYQLDSSKTPGGLGMFGFDASYYEVNLNLGSLVLDPDTVQVTSATYSNGTPTEWKEGTGYWTIPLEVTDTDEESVCKPFTISFDCTIPASEFVDTDSVMPMAEFVFDVYHNGPGSNLKPVLSISDAAPLTSSTLLLPAVTITPADLTIYQGGDEGYEGVYGDETIDLGSNSLPHPLFKIATPASVSNIQVTGLTFKTEDGSKSWTPVSAGKDAEGNELYYFQEAEGTPPVRVTYTNGEGDPVLSDDFVVGEDVQNTYAEYTIDLYAGENEEDFSNIKADTYPISVNSGILTVRAVENKNDPTSDIVATEPTSAVKENKAVAVALPGTTYTLNDTDVALPTDGTAKPSLLFDEIITSDGVDRIDALKDAVDTKLGTTNGTRHYEAKYLDLVDANNGNAWIKASNDVTIYWGYPKDTDQNTTFKLLHFEDLHRDTSGGDTTGFNPGDIDDSNIKEVEVTNNSNGISFTVESGGFSPFVLVWETAAEEPGTDPDPNPGGGSGGDSHSDPTGNLTISLGGNGGNEDFIFTVIFTDEDGDELENNFYYNGDYTGTIGSGDEITLTGGDKIVIRNLPEGTRYEVIIETADGYTATSTGAEGVIRTSGNEAAFSVTPTVVLADPSVTGVTRWLNTTDHTAYLSGYPGGTFGPDNSMTRAEVAQMFYALLLNKDVTITKTFSDVPADAWYATAVNTLASLGMVSGDPDGTFRPNDPITRAEFCVIALAFAYEPDNAVCYFGDVSRSDWFYTYVAQAASYGWIGGYTDGSFGPNQQITRAQVTTIVNNMLGRAADRDYVIDHQNTLVQFNDLTRAHWAYFQIMEATNAHNYTKSNGTENWR